MYVLLKSIHLINHHCSVAGKAYIFLEYCPLGSLEKFLRKNKHLFKCGEDKAAKTVADIQYNNLYQNDLSGNTGHIDTQTISGKDLLLWSLQLANAVQFLASKKVTLILDKLLKWLINIQLKCNFNTWSGNPCRYCHTECSSFTKGLCKAHRFRIVTSIK